MSQAGKILIRFETWVKRQQFLPDRAGIFVNPVYLIRRALYKSIRRLSNGIQGRLLDFGCGHSPYLPLFPDCEYHGIDIDLVSETEYLRKFDGIKIPHENAIFDAVLCTEVLEHVPDENKMLVEISRVLKPGGMLVLTTPFFWEEHGHPYDYRRLTTHGLIILLEKHGFTVIRAEKSSGTITTLFQVFISKVYARIKSRHYYLDLLITLLYIAPINILAVLLSKLQKKNGNIYLNIITLSKKNG
jgi:SAM-dependent methyltransferase